METSSGIERAGIKGRRVRRTIDDDRERLCRFDAQESLAISRLLHLLRLKDGGATRAVSIDEWAILLRVATDLLAGLQTVGAVRVVVRAVAAVWLSALNEFIGEADGVAAELVVVCDVAFVAHGVGAGAGAVGRCGELDTA